MNDGSERPDLAPIHLESEFGSVTLKLDRNGNGDRLRIFNEQNHQVVYLDPLELASLTWLTHADLGPFLDPSQVGWVSEDPE